MPTVVRASVIVIRGGLRPSPALTARITTGTAARPASAHGKPNAPAANPTASGPIPAAIPAAVLSVTATELRPGRLPYRRACSSGYHGAVAALSTARITSLGAMPGTSRKPG
jgi:hypothetical protein